MGRPRKASRRDCQLNVRFTTEERKLVQAHADKRGEEPVEFVRRISLEQSGFAPALSLPSRFDQLMELQLRRLGNLLNQLVRHMHLTGEISPDAATLLRDVRILINRFL